MTDLKRILAAGATTFLRNGLVSFATVIIMTVTLVIIGSSFFASAIVTHNVDLIEDKVSVNVYFKTDVEEANILAVKTILEQRSDVAEVSYTSREDALTKFRQNNADDELTLQAINELSENPLGASLTVRVRDTMQYETIINFLENDDNISSSKIIDRINYYQNKPVIDRLAAAVDAMRRAGLAIVGFFSLATIVIAFTTVRLAIYTSREEISVKRLVGASNVFIRGPFIVAGILSGALAGVVALALLYPVAWYAGANATMWLGGINLHTYYLQNLPLIILMLTGSGMLLGGLASYLGVRRYLSL